ncbi:hypothetical protein ABVK25_011480 [Lepraria finkii]|uniref:Rhodopsin domain-containing protein n=1 Tax=Lepraria finkii TaxID=1340010 RepID=A0ABR4ARM3_9LECA
MVSAANVMIILTVILGGLAIGAVALRQYCRVYQKHSIGADDYCILIALALSTGIDIVIDYALAVTGAGDPNTVPTQDGMVYILKILLGCELSQIATMGFVKASLLFYYKRIFVSRFFVIASNTLIILIACFTASIFLAQLFSKWPIYEQWNPEAAYNISIPALLTFFVAGNSTFDLITLCLPLLVIRTLQMKTHRKVILSSIFALGSLCMIASLFRLYWSIEYTKAPNTGKGYFSEPFIYNSLWAIIEPPLFIIMGSFITLGPLLRSKYGPGNLFRSLRTYISRRIAKGFTHSSDWSNEAGKSSNHSWKVLQEPIKSKGPTNRAQWELSEISTTSDV